MDNIYVGPSEVKNPNLLEYNAKSPTAVEVAWQGNEDIELYLAEYNQMPKPTDKGRILTGDYTVIDQLPEGKLWHAYIKDRKNGAMWVGPYPVATAFNLPYRQDFEGDLLKGNVYVDDFKQGDNKFFYKGGKLMVATTSEVDDMTIKKIYLPPVYIPKGTKLDIKFDMVHLNHLANPEISLVAYDIRGNQFMTLWSKQIEDTDAPVSIDEPVGEFVEGGTYNLALLYSTEYNDSTTDYNILCIDNFAIGTTESLSVQEATAPASLSLYPNPVTTDFSISSPSEVRQVEIFSTDGKQLAKHSAGKTYSVSHLPKGLYLVKITTKTGVVTKKLIKK